jgi:ribonuclease P protein component
VGDFAFSGKQRLLSAHDFARVFKSADARASHKYVLLLAARNGLAHNRLGLVVAKKHVKLAVHRNRFKRVTREFFRHCPPTHGGMDVVVLARKNADLLDNATLSTILRQQWQKLTRYQLSPLD